jgi:sulfotransferase
MLKQYYFLCGLPRAGNTLLASLINQNPNITLTANSIVPEIIYQLASLKKTEIYRNFPDWKSLDNVIMNTFDSYYKDYSAEHIIDRGPWGTPQNLEYIKGLFDKPKFIILVRPVVECLASFLKVEDTLVDDLDSRSDELMGADGIIGKNISSIQNLKDENVFYLSYNNLTKFPEEALKRIYKFLGIPLWGHRFVNLDQFKVNGIKYDDSIVAGENMHTIKTDRIRPTIYKVDKFITQRVFDKYKEQIDYINQFA